MIDLQESLKQLAVKATIEKAKNSWREKHGGGMKTFGTFLVEEGIAGRDFFLPLWFRLVLPRIYTDDLIPELNRQLNRHIEKEGQRPFVEIHRRPTRNGKFAWYAVRSQHPSGRLRYKDRP